MFSRRWSSAIQNRIEMDRVIEWVNKECWRIGHTTFMMEMDRRRNLIKEKEYDGDESPLASDQVPVNVNMTEMKAIFLALYSRITYLRLRGITGKVIDMGEK